MERKQILVVVDDDIEFRGLIANLFKEHPVDVLAFGTGEEAIEFLQTLRVHPDLIVLDVELEIGGLSGPEVAHQLRTQCQIESPILFLSAEPTVDIWTQSIPGSRALSKSNSLRRIFDEITGARGKESVPLMDLPQPSL